MTETSEIKLNFFKTIWKEYQWFLIYEFQLTGTDFFRLTDKEILKALIGTRVLSNSLYHPEMDESETEVSVKNVSRPYDFGKIEISNFKFLQSKTDFEEWLIKFRTADWEDDREDAQSLLDKSEYALWSRTNLDNGVWFLSKEQFEEESDKLAELHWIYLHFETFIEIDREKETIRTFDFGYD